jgi:hypothetical protein
MARIGVIRACVVSTLALAFSFPQTAFAQTTEELALRVRELEDALTALRTELETMRSQEVQHDADLLRIQQPATTVAAGSPTPPTDGFRIGASTFRLGGFVKTEALYSDYSSGDIATGAGRDFYVPATIPVGAISEDAALDLHAKQTRLSFTVNRAVEGHSLTAYLEADFQSSPGNGTELVTNAYNFAVRRATVSYDRWLFGQDWSTFQNVAALPETTDFIGPTEGTVFSRQTLVRYTLPLGEHTSLALAMENPETSAFSISAPTITGFDDDAVPDFVARLNWSPGRSQFVLAGLLRRLSVEDAGASREANGWGLSASGKVAMGQRDDLRFMVTFGEGIGRYVGLGFAPDAVFRGKEMEAVGVTAGFAALRHVWSDRLRSSFTYSFQNVDNDIGLSPTSANVLASSYSANLFFSPVQGLDLGVEYQHAERELFNDASGDLDRLHFVAKQTF